jgi:hypothetical protein
MRRHQSTIRLLFGLLAVVTGGLLHAAESDLYLPVSRDSVFIRDLLQRPITANPRDTRIAATLLHRTGNHEESTALDRFEKRRLLARFLGEEFEFSGTVGQAIEAESAAEAFENVISRALALVTIEYAAPGTISSTPESGQPGRDVQMPMVIRHTLHVPATAVGIAIGRTTVQGRPQPYYLFLTCKPANAAAFAPGISHPAMCTGRAEREGSELAIKALLERQIPEPLPANSFMSDEADLFDDFLRINDKSAFAAAAMAATTALASARCEDLGNCEEVARERASARRQAARPSVLTALTIAAALLAGFAARRTPARTSTGWWVDTLSILVIAVSILMFVVMFKVTTPGLGLEGVVYFTFLLFGLLPHLVVVGFIGAAIARGGATRLRVFALSLGLLAPALVWLGIFAFAS